ncbi:MAG: metal ABC transporter permease [Candidatus Liptonbacteria bacterium]|nr:metal ABC transporter permease [Candidatus Liptonbacteria bacterium]
MTNNELLSIILAAITALVSGVVGSFALMRKMALAGDALSHVALPGIGVALIYSLNPAIGGGLALLVGAILIWKIERVTNLNTEAIIGVLFAVSLAAGGLLIESEHELEEALFGGVATVTVNEFIAGVAVAVLSLWFLLRNRHALVLSLISKDLAKTAGVKTETQQLYFLLIFSITVILGLKFLGVLLMGSLIIIPAATARNVTQTLSGMLATASCTALIAVLGGFAARALVETALGPSIISIAGLMFFISLLARRA